MVRTIEITKPRGRIERPPFVDTVDLAKRVGFIVDGTWRVGWEKPQTEEDKKADRRRFDWHKHKDPVGVLRQNDRVVKRYLGITVKPPEDGIIDPELSAVPLSTIRDELVLHGDIPYATDIAKRIFNVIHYANAEKSNPMAVAAQLHGLMVTLKPFSSDDYVEARDHLSQGLNSNVLEILKFEAMKAIEPLFHRAQKGTSIVLSLYQRAAHILRWINGQEHGLRELRNTASGIVFFYAREKLPNQDAIDRLGLLIPTTQNLESFANLPANPFRELGEKPEVARLVSLRNSFESGKFGEVLEMAQEAYASLDNFLSEHTPSIVPEYFKRYQVPI